MKHKTGLQPDGQDAQVDPPISPAESAATPHWQQVRPLWLIIAAIVLLALALIWLRSGSSPTPAAQLPVISVIVPGTSVIEHRIEATGTIAARRSLPVSAVGEGGRVVAVPVDAGQWVKKGQILARIDRGVQDEQTRSAAAQLEAARADARLATANFERALKLVEKGFISQADIDRLRATRDAAVARVKVADAQWGEMRARTARLDITAPAGGLLLSRNAEPAQVVSGGSGVLFTIAEGGEMELLAEVGEDDLSRLAVGAMASVTPAGSTTSFTGTIWQIAPTIDPQTRLGQVRIALAYAPELRPGGFASVTIDAGKITAPVLPESAILSDDKGTFALVLGKENSVVRQPVTTGVVSAQGIAVTHGLTGTERVVLRAGGFLAPGDRIEPRLVAPTVTGTGTTGTASTDTDTTTTRTPIKAGP